MSTLVIKNFADDLHARLKEQAERNRRSVTKEVITIIERDLTAPRTAPRIAPKLSPPIKLKGGPLTDRDLNRWKRSGRA
jgi:hypothetical protein